MSSNEAVRQLQEALLRAVLLGQPLPGGAEPVRLPDLSFVVRRQVVLLLDTHLGGPIAISESPWPIRVMAAEALRREAESHGEVPFLQFQPPELTDDTVGLTLEGRIATGDPNRPMLGLSSIHARFARIGGEWRLAEEPIYSAA